jgi:hypothetical protein
MTKKHETLIHVESRTTTQRTPSMIRKAHTPARREGSTKVHSFHSQQRARTAGHLVHEVRPAVAAIKPIGQASQAKEP